MGKKAPKPESSDPKDTRADLNAAQALLNDAARRRESARDRFEFSTAVLRAKLVGMAKEDAAELKRFARAHYPKDVVDEIWEEVDRQNAEIAESQVDLKRTLGIDDEEK
ncbi:MAG: hypothetical protein WDM91_17535 [Rhizomicrobium sp.]